MARDHSDGMDSAQAAFEQDLSGGASDGPKESVFDGLDQETEGDDEDGKAGQSDDEDGDEGGGDDEGTDDESDPDEAEDDESEDDESEEDEGQEDGDDAGDAEGLDLKSKVKLGEKEVELGEAPVTVTVDGEKKQVPLSEALAGYIRQDTFYNRLNKLNEAKEFITKEAEGVAVGRQHYIKGIESLMEQLQALEPKEPDWDALYAADPVSARQQEQKWKEYKIQKAVIAESRDSAIKEQTEHERKRLVNYVNSEQVKVLDAIPEWVDDKTRSRDQESMKKTAKAAGFKDEEISTIYDHRMVVVLRKAAAFDRLTAKTNKPDVTRKVESRPNATRTASPTKGPVRKGGDRSMQRLARSGSVQDATAVFERFLK